MPSTQTGKLAPSDLDLWGDEPRESVVERLVELASEQLVLPGLDLVDPLPAERVRRQHPVPRHDVVAVLALEVVDHAETEPEAVPTVLRRIHVDHEHDVSVVLDDVVLDLSEQLEAVEGHEVVRQATGVERRTDVRLEPRADHVVPDVAAVVDLETVDPQVR